VGALAINRVLFDKNNKKIKQKTMLIIFAKYKTDEKAAIWCLPYQKQDILIALEKQYGGRWLPVDEMMTGGEILKFNDGQIYKGFNPNIKRYSKAIDTLKIQSNE
jgi:hypothetical protein